jgi:hypothetical protein
MIPWTRLKPSQTQPPAPKTGHAHERCYAAALTDCSTKISREHYISKGLLGLMGGTVDVAGLSFQQPDTLRGLPEKSLTAKALCERHNHALAPLDAEVARLYEALRDFDAGLRDSASWVSEERVVNGADIERWMLKALAGLTHGKLLTSTKLRVDSGWLHILFGGRWPTGWGLYLRIDSAPAHAFGGLEITTLTHGDAVWGGIFNIGGLTLELALGRPGTDEPLVHRPAGVQLSRSDASETKHLTFGWPQPPPADYVSFTRRGEYAGDRPQDVHLRRV